MKPDPGLRPVAQPHPWTAPVFKRACGAARVGLI